MKHNTPEHNIRELFYEHFHAMVSASFRIVKDYNQAEDIVQDVFIKLWQNYDRVGYLASLKSYLSLAVRNSSLNYVRDKKVREKWFKETDNSILETLNMPLEDIQKRIEIGKVHEAVDRIPEKWREAFILSKYENLKYSEIAKKMSISEKTVEKYITKALNLLRIELKDLLAITILLQLIRKL